MCGIVYFDEIFQKSIIGNTKGKRKFKTLVVNKLYDIMEKSCFERKEMT